MATTLRADRELAVTTSKLSFDVDDNTNYNPVSMTVIVYVHLDRRTLVVGAKSHCKTYLAKHGGIVFLGRLAHRVRRRISRASVGAPWGRTTAVFGIVLVERPRAPATPSQGHAIETKR